MAITSADKKRTRKKTQIRFRTNYLKNWKLELFRAMVGNLKIDNENELFENKKNGQEVKNA